MYSHIIYIIGSLLYGAGKTFKEVSNLRNAAHSILTDGFSMTEVDVRVEETKKELAEILRDPGAALFSQGEEYCDVAGSCLYNSIRGLWTLDLWPSIDFGDYDTLEDVFVAIETMGCPLFTSCGDENCGMCKFFATGKPMRKMKKGVAKLRSRKLGVCLDCFKIERPRCLLGECRIAHFVDLK